MRSIRYARGRWVAWIASAMVIGGAQADDGAGILSLDHYVPTRSTVPAIEGQTVALYVRERVRTGMLARTRDFTGRVALFVHGAGTPAEVAFDVPYGDYSWMAYLAAAGFDVFSMDVTGYGRSTRPHVMNDACNLRPEQRAALGRDCEPSYGYAVGNIGAEWNDIDAVVDYLRALRGVDTVALLGWSLGGPRAGGYAAQHPAKVSRVVLLAPAYDRDRGDDPPRRLPAEGAAFNTQSLAEFTSNWDRQIGCAGQRDPVAATVVWREMLASDPVGATWGPGVRRAPQTTVWSFNRKMAAAMRTPMLIVQGVHDKQVSPERAEALFEDLGAPSKVYVDLACASHNAMWEGNHELLFRASREWLERGTVDGIDNGALKMGYE